MTLLSILIIRQSKLKTILFSLLLPINMIGQWSITNEDTIKHEKWNLFQKFTNEEWNASNFASEKEMKWFNDARYGMFIHFGLATYIGEDLSWGMCHTRKAPDKGQGKIADSIWVKYPQKFKLENFNAKKWVQIAQKAGMKYIVTIAKHHDGFHMWDTKYSDFKVTNTPFGRDYLKEIADACHEANMKFGIYYSQRDWYHPDYSPVDTSLIERIITPPYFKAKAGVNKVIPGPQHDKYIEYQFNVVRELCTKYGKVDIFWFDACWWGGMFTAEMWKSEKLTRMIRKLQPGIIINNRASIPGDFDTPEQKIGMHQLRPWESCVSLCKSWSWSNTPNKDKKTIIKMITATATGNGNMLMSWGPKWDGIFDPKQVARLEEVGDWMSKYGNTIYSTRGGPWLPSSWGGSTYRNNKAYVHITGKLEKNLILSNISNKIKNAKCVTGGYVEFEQTSKNIILDLSKVKPNEASVIIELCFKNEISKIALPEKKLSKFIDPSYGEIIYSTKKLKTNNGIITIDLGKLQTVKGIQIKDITSKNKGIFKVEISENNSTWNLVKKDILPEKIWEIAVTKFNAGIDLPGIKTRYIKISLDKKESNSFQLNQILVYGEK